MYEIIPTIYKLNDDELASFQPKDGFQTVYAYFVCDKIYIGQTSKKLIERHKQHIKPNGKTPFDKILRKNTFQIYVLGQFPKDEIIDYEAYFIEKYGTMFPNGWNFVKYGVNPEYTEETRKKMSISAKNKDPEVFKRMAETKKRQYKEHPESHPFLGRKHSEETINKMKQIHQTDKYIQISIENLPKDCTGSKNGFYGKHHSEETKQKIRKCRNKQIEMYSMDGEYIRTFDSVTDASVFLCGTTQYVCSISECARGVYRKSHGYIWKYKEKL